MRSFYLYFSIYNSFFKEDPDYENAKRSLATQKVRFNDAQQILRDAQNSALSFRNNPVYSNPQTNQIQVEDYNSMRKTKSSLAFQNRRKPTDVYSSINSYNMNGSILNSPKSYLLGQHTSHTSLVSPRQDVEPNLAFVENYVAADGTQYKIYNAPSGHTVKEVNCPTRNVIHVPGKYHEHYRSTVVESELPQNIKHKFRARLAGDAAEVLLNDQLKVHDTISHIQNSGIIKKNDKTDETINANNIEFKMEKKLSDYYDLGNHLRHAISHGYPSVYKVSHKEDVHNNSVSKEYLSEWDLNVKSPWRRRKDWIGRFLIFLIKSIFFLLMTEALLIRTE